MEFEGIELPQAYQCIVLLAIGKYIEQNKAFTQTFHRLIIIHDYVCAL